MKKKTYIDEADIVSTLNNNKKKKRTTNKQLILLIIVIMIINNNNNKRSIKLILLSKYVKNIWDSVFIDNAKEQQGRKIVIFAKRTKKRHYSMHCLYTQHVWIWCKW